MDYKDYYAILGVQPTATEDDIKRAYRKRARQYHPDVSKEPNAETKFKELGEAYEALKDPEKRKLYDQYGKDWKSAQGQSQSPPPGWQGGASQAYSHFGGEDDYSEFFSSLFGDRGARGSRRAQQRHPLKADDLRYRISISLEEAYKGASRQIKLPISETDANGQTKQTTRTLNIKVPVGVTEGQAIRLAGQGNTIANGQPGDLYLEVQIQTHPLFKLNQKDVHLILPVTPWEAALGATITTPTLGGNVDLKIAPGAQSGQQLRLKGRGLAGADQYVTLKVVLPPATTEQAKEIYQRMATELAFNPREMMGV